MWTETPFKVADLALNSILHRANIDLLALAARFGTPAERSEIADTAGDDAPRHRYACGMPRPGSISRAT